MQEARIKELQDEYSLYRVKLDGSVFTYLGADKDRSLDQSPIDQYDLFGDYVKTYHSLEEFKNSVKYNREKFSLEVCYVG